MKITKLLDLLLSFLKSLTCEFSFSLSLFLSIGAVAQNSSLISEGAELNLVSDQFTFTEGPAVNKKGDVFFTDQPNNKIWKYSTKGELSIYMDEAGRSNGLFFDAKDNLIACADGDNELWRISKNKTPEVLAKNWEDKRFNGPNDVWVHTSEGMYFTDPFYKRKYWKHTEMEQTEQRLYYRSPSGQISMVADGFMQPNGLVGKDNTLFVTDIRGKKTFKFDIQPDGKLTNKTLFCEQGSDGMTIDELGNLYLVGKGITIYNPSGEVIEKIAVPENWTANITFGGKKRQTLFITASKAIYTMEMNVKGAN
ncbi:MAG: gluconolactonase [Algoriphagus sp.]|jgi:gluconolactonase